MKIIKRDGRIVNFDKEKIKSAVLKAFQEVDGEITLYAKDKARDIANYIEDVAAKADNLSVESIQDLVENKLMDSNRKDVARAYIIYRNARSKERERKSWLMQNVTEKLNASSVQNQNANVDEKSFGGRIGEVNSTVMKQYALNYCMSPMSRDNHLNNEIYIHDLDHYAVGDHNCLTIPFDDLLAKGFNTRQADVRPAGSINTAFQLLAVIFQLQSLQQFGGVSAGHLDWTMVPYVRKSFRKHWNDGVKYIAQGLSHFPKRWRKIKEDLPINEYPDYDDCAPVYHYAMDKIKKEIEQAVEGMYHNLEIWAW